MILASIELPVLIVYILMAIGFIGLIWGVKNMSTKPNARIIMYGSVVLIIGAVAASFMVSGEKTEDARLVRNVKQFQTAKAERVASYIADRFSGGDVAFLIDESSLNVPLEDYSNSFVLEEIKNRLSEKGVSVGDTLIVGESKQVVDKSGEEKTVVEEPTNAKIMKSKLDSVYDKVDIVVNFVGLPDSLSDLRTITFLTRKNTATGKNNMLLLSDRGLPYVDQDMIRNGRVCAVLDYLSEEGAAFDMQKDTAPKDLDEAFDYNYFLLDQNSLSSFIDKNEYYFVTQ